MAYLDSWSGQSDASTTASTASFTVPAGATFAAVFVGMRGADGGATTLTSVTMGGENFTLNATTMRRFDSFQAMQAGYLLSADMPSGTVTATATRTTGTNGMTIAVLFFDDAEQQVPTIGLAGNASGGDPFDTAITMPTAGVMVDGIVTANGASSFTTNQGSQTSQEAQNVSGASCNSWSSTRAVSSGSQTMGWDTGSNTQRTSHIVFGIEEAAASQTVTQADTTPEDGVLQSFTTTGLTGTITAASLSGKDILSDLSNTDPTTATTYTVDVSAVETSEGMPRIGETSTLSVTATGGAPTTNVTIQPATGWAVVTLAGTLDKTTDGFLDTLDTDLGLTSAVGDIIYYDASDNAVISATGVYTSDLTEAGENTEFVIQQGGSATTTATSEGAAFYPYGEAGGTGVPQASRQTAQKLGIWLGSEGYTGAYNDKLNSFLVAEGYTTGSLNDKMFNYLDDLGYTGTFEDRLHQWQNDDS